MGRPPEDAMCSALGDVRFVPIADIRDRLYGKKKFARCSTGSVADLHVPQYAATITVDDPLAPDVAIAPVTIRTIVIGIGAIIVGIRITIVAATVVRRGEQSADDGARG